MQAPSDHSTPLPTHLSMHQDRFCESATMARLLWFVVALWTLTAAAAVARAATDCSTVIPSVMDCLGFVSDGSTDPKPTKQCCVGIDGVIKNMPECLCEAVKVAPTVGNLNMTRILGLPDACTLKTPDLECIKNAMHPPPPAPAPAMASPTPAPAPQLPAPSPSPVTPPSAPSPLPPTTPTTPAAPPTTPPAPSPLPSVTAPPSASTPPAPSPVPSVASPPPPTPPMPSPPSSAPATPVTPPADDDVPAPAPNGTSKSSKAAKLATLMALAGSIGFVLSGLMP